MLKLKLQYFGYLMWTADSFEKTLMLGKIEGRRRRERQRMRWLNGITDWWIWVWVNSGSRWWTGRPGVLQSMGSQRVRHNWVTEQQQSYFTNEDTEMPVEEIVWLLWEMEPSWISHTPVKEVLQIWSLILVWENFLKCHIQLLDCPWILKYNYVPYWFWKRKTE